MIALAISLAHWFVRPTTPCGLHCASAPAVPPAIPCDDSTPPIQLRSEEPPPAPPRTCRRNSIARDFVHRRARRGLARVPACATGTAWPALMRSDVGEKSTLVATRMFNTSQRMTKLVEDLIDFTRTQSGGKFPITISQSNLHKICEEAVEEQKIANPSRTIVIHAEGLFDSMLDKSRIAQVLSNILGNAIQHGTTTGPIVVTLNSFEDNVSVPSA